MGDQPAASAPVQTNPDRDQPADATAASSSLEADQITPKAGADDSGGDRSKSEAPAKPAQSESETGKAAPTSAKLAGPEPLADGGADGPMFPPGWANGSYGSPGYQCAVIVDYLTFFTKNPLALPALVIGGSVATDNLTIITSGIGDLDLAGGNGASQQYGMSSGMRLWGIYWWDQCPDYGVEASGLFLGKQGLDLRVDNVPVISRPFGNASDNSSGSFLVAFPGIASGGVTIHSDMQLQGVEVNSLYRIVDDPIVGGWSMTNIFGFRYLELDDGLLINSVTSYNRFPAPNLTTPLINSLAGSQIRVSDSFLTKNRFAGIQSGLDLLVYLDIGRLNFRTNVGIGVNHEELTIRGSQLRVNPDGSSVASNGGLLALPSNIGHHTREEFVVVPEFNLNWLVPLTESIHLSLGYTFIYMDRVIRPGNQIDRTIDVSQVPNFSSLGVKNSLNRPAVNFSQGDFYAHGFNVGIQFRW
jgi:hypothetical protein